VSGVSPAANSALSDGSLAWRDGKTSFGEFFLVAFFAERNSASLWTMPFLFRFAGGGFGGLLSGIGEAFMVEID
jgi:hypothetical protein